MYTILPFDNNVVTMKVTGAKLKELIQHGINPDGFGWGQYSGLTVWYDSATDEITSMRLSDGTKVEDDEYYTLTSIDFLMTGGDSYNFDGHIDPVIIAKEDYLRFIEVLKRDLNYDKFDFQCFQTDKKYNVLIPNMKIRKKDTYIEEVNFLLKNRCQGSNGVFVDISWYAGVSENKLIDQLYRTSIKLLMPIMVLLDNIGINPLPFKYLVEGIANHYAKVNHNSKYVSQTIAIPWEKFMHEPIFKREDIFPFKDCEFEGRTYMTYNNPMAVVHKWYGANCTKKWNGHEWIETYPIEKRHTKHVRNLNLESNEIPNNE